MSRLDPDQAIERILDRLHDKPAAPIKIRPNEHRALKALAKSICPRDTDRGQFDQFYDRISECIFDFTIRDDHCSHASADLLLYFAVSEARSACGDWAKAIEFVSRVVNDKAAQLQELEKHNPFPPSTGHDHHDEPPAGLDGHSHHD
jgi:hypothetical protein